MTTLNRRERVRAATVTEITDTARRILVAQGPDGLSLRAIARDMGMTAPALYRYFDSREALLVHLIGALYGELADTLEAARDAVPADEPGAQLAAVSRAFRAWALAHRPEFGLLFGSPVPGIEVDPQDATGAAGRRFGQVFGELVARVHEAYRFPVPAPEDLDPALRGQLEAYAADLPVGVAQVFLSGWVRLYGMVAMEVFGHLRFALADPGPLFERELRALGRDLGFPDQPPAAPGPGPAGPA